MDLKYDVFLSKNSKDDKEVQRLLAFLENAGLSVFESEKSLPKLGLADYAQAIDNAIDLSRNLIVLCSANELGTGEGNNSRWVYYEWTLFRNELLSKRKNGNLLTVLCGGININMLSVGLRKYQSFKLDNIEKTGILDYIQNRETINEERIHLSFNRNNTVVIDLKMFDFGYHFSMCKFAKMQNNNTYDIYLQEDLDEIKESPWKESSKILSENDEELAEKLKTLYGQEAVDIFSLGQYCGISESMALFVILGAVDVYKELKKVLVPYIRLADSLGIPQSVIGKIINMVMDKDQERIVNYHKLVRRSVALRNETSRKCPYCGAITTIESEKCYNCKNLLKL